MAKEIEETRRKISRFKQTQERWEYARPGVKIAAGFVIAGVAVGFGSLKAHPAHDGIHTDYDDKRHFGQAIHALERIETHEERLEPRIEELRSMQSEIGPGDVQIENLQAKAAGAGMILGFGSAAMAGAAYAGIRMRDMYIARKENELLSEIEEIKQEREIARSGKIF